MQDAHSEGDEESSFMDNDSTVIATAFVRLSKTVPASDYEFADLVRILVRES